LREVKRPDPGLYGCVRAWKNQQEGDMAEPPSNRFRVYISYSHPDAEWKDRILKHLMPLEAQGRLILWDDSRLQAGMMWEDEISRQRAQASIAILLISAHFLSSDHITQEEVPDLLRHRDETGMRVIPVLVSPCSWQNVDWLSQIQIYPKNAAPIATMSEAEQERVLAGLARELGSILDSLAQEERDRQPESRTQPTPPDSEGQATSDLSEKRFRVAFSFPGEKREFVGKVASILAERFGREAILYDEFHKVEFPSYDLASLLSRVFDEEVALVVAIVSGDYDKKQWVGLDLEEVLSLTERHGSDRVMLCRFGGVLPLGLSPAEYVALDHMTPQDFVALILQRLATIEGQDEDHYVANKPPRKEQKRVPPRQKPGKKRGSVEDALVAGPAGFHSEFRAVRTDGEVKDYLEVEAEAVRLAELIALSETNMPLAVGLFGNWGTGKSHFMGLLRMHMMDRANAARGKDGPPDERWCKEIVPIVFNAWHYLDSNLWASLVSEIFERLFDRLQPKGDALQKVQEKLREVNGAMARAQEEVVVTQAAVKKATSEFEAAQQEAEEAQTLYAGMVDQLKELLPELKKMVRPERIAELLGVEPELATLSALKKKNEDLAGLPGQVRGLWWRITAPQGRAYRIGVLLSAVCLGPLLLWLVGKAAPGFEEWLIDVGPSVKHALQGVASLLTAATPFFVELQVRVRQMSTLQKQAEDAQKQKEKTPGVIEAKERLEATKAMATRAELKLAETKVRQNQLQKEAEELGPGRRIGRFIEDRARSADYRDQLGIVSLVRRDFQELSDLFADKAALEKRIAKLNEEADEREKIGEKAEGKAQATRQQEEAEQLRKEAKELQSLHGSIDRIVLFVDDLDRCQPEKVVDVLQAVHLLLAFPLFAVVVGVDQRCLRTSLQEQFKGLLAESAKNNGKEHAATPLDYIEKIFHVPFHLPAMDKDGFGKLIWELSAPRQVEGKPTEVEASRTAAVPKPKPVTELPIPTQPVSTPLPVGTALVKTSTTLVGSVPLQEWERKALKGYHPLIRTPRGAIRLLNTYRLVRAGLTDDNWQKFRPDGNEAGEAAVAMLLLAVAAGHPSVAREWFAALRRAGGSTWVIARIDEVRHRGDWAELDAALDQFTRLADATEKDTDERLQKRLPSLPQPSQGKEPLLYTWLRRVERFTF
jgi:hypothetical protein